MIKIIDNKVIDDLMEIGDKEFLDEMIDIFLSQSEGLIQEITQASETGNVSKLLKSSHKLKGSCLNLGASELGNICHQLEVMSKKADLSDVNKVIDLLDSVYQQTCSELIKLK